MRIYMIRHGQSEANLNGVHAGQADALLTDNGREDARRAGTVLKGIKFDKVYCSDLSRAKETCAIALPNAVPEYTSLIREIDIGNLEGEKFTDCIKKMGDYYIEKRWDFDFTSWNGENKEMFLCRAKKFLSILEERNDETVAVFCHAGFIKFTFEAVLGVEFDKRKITCDNGAVCVFEFTDGKWTLKAWNRTTDI